MDQSQSFVFLETDLPIGIAHRGGAQLRPENTLLAFENARTLGFRYIETDVHLSRDGVLVCLHDASVDRTTEGSGAVCEFSLEQLKQLDAGYRFEDEEGRFPFRAQGCRIPTLKEALELDTGLRFIVEMKGNDPTIAEALWSFIEEERVHERVLGASFSPRVGKRFRQLAGNRVASSADTRLARLFWAAAKLGLGWITRPSFQALEVPHYDRSIKVITPGFINAAHHKGLHVHAWTINERDEMLHLLNLGVDGIITDCPDVLLECLKK